MDEVYVVEVAATGPRGVPGDAVAEVAVCRMDADGRDFDTVFSELVSMDPRDLGKDSLDYMSSNYGIEPEELYGGIPAREAAGRLQRVIYGKECTSYNVGNAFGKHLSFEPWDCARELTLLPSISMRLDPDLRGPPEEEHRLIRRAYDRLCPGDPACVGEGGRAMDLAQMAVSVLMVLRTHGWLRSHHPDRQVVQSHQEQAAQVHQRVDDPERHRQEDGYHAQREHEGGGENQQPQDQGDVPQLPAGVPVDEAQPQEAHEAGDQGQEEGDGAVPRPRPIIFRSSHADGLRLRRDPLVALGAGDAGAGDQLPAVRAAAVGHVSPSSSRRRCTPPRR